MSLLQRECLYNPQSCLADGLRSSSQQDPKCSAHVKPVTGYN